MNNERFFTSSWIESFILKNQSENSFTFITKSLTPRFKESPQYGYGWWLQKRGDKSFFMMRGHLGQYVIVEPTDNVIIVRLGHQKSPDADTQIFSDDISVYIEEAYKMLSHAPKTQP